MYNINGTFFLDYQYLLNKIPRSWITQINDNRVFIFENKINVTCNVFVKKLMKAKKGSRVFYDTFVNVNDYIPQNKLQAEIGGITENEWKSYFLSSKKWHEAKLRDFQYKMNNNILGTNLFLAKTNKIDSGVCSYCKEQPEKIHHLFLPCPKVKNYWRELREWLNTNVIIELSLDNREILFSYTGYNELVNYIYALAKLSIYQNKFISRTINIQGFIFLLKKKMLSEKYISFLNNKINKFFKKWSPVYNYFFPTVTEE